MVDRCDPAYKDFVPTVVPAGFIADYSGGKNRNWTGPENPGPQDLSWTTAFPLIPAWLHEFYGDSQLVRQQYAALVRWTEAQIAVGRNLSMEVPQFYNCKRVQPLSLCLLSKPKGARLHSWRPLLRRGVLRGSRRGEG